MEREATGASVSIAPRACPMIALHYSLSMPGLFHSLLVNGFTLKQRITASDPRERRGQREPEISRKNCLTKHLTRFFLFPDLFFFPCRKRQLNICRRW